MPPAPVGLRVTDVNDDSVELEWCSAEDHPPKGFDVQWKLYHQIQWESANVMFPRCKKKNLEQGTRYCFRVRVAAHGREAGVELVRSIDATTTEPFKQPSPVKRRESPILKRAASEFMKNFRRKAFRRRFK